jgi:hypothetical protein
MKYTRKASIQVAPPAVLKPTVARQKRNPRRPFEKRDQLGPIRWLQNLHATVETSGYDIQTGKYARKGFLVGGEQPFEEFIDHIVAGETPFIPFSLNTLANVKCIHDGVLEKSEDHTEASR